MSPLIEAGRRRLEAVLARIALLGLIPPPVRRPSWDSIKPRGKLAWASVVLLALVFLFYAHGWIQRQPEFLFDTNYENDDVRTALFPFHRYDQEHALRDDPVANEMIKFTMPGISFAYRVLIPLVGIFVAPKAMQALAIALVLWAGVVLARSRRGGLAAGVLLVFLIFREPFVVNRLSSGFGRAFAFPCYALWLAGAITRDTRARWAAILVGAVTQNYTIAILLGCEGFDLAMGLLGKHRHLVFTRAKRYLVIVGLSGVLVGGYLMSVRGMGHVQTLAQVEASEAFKARHKTEYPLVDPGPHFMKAVFAPFAEAGEALPSAEEHFKDYADYQTTGPLLIIAILIVLVATRLSPRAGPAAAFLGSSVILYALARYLAYRLYAPERYYAFGGPMVGVALGVIALGLIGPRLRKHRATVRNLVAAAFVLGLTVVAGDGVVFRNGMTINREKRAELYEFVATLPPNARLACHPWDGDDIPWWSGRATTGGYETAQMWLVEGAERVEKREDAVLTALYATDRGAVLSYAKKWKVSHFLLHPDRYKGDIERKSSFIEPMTTFARKLIEGRLPEDFVLASPPESSIIYREKGAIIVDVQKLDRAWKKKPKPAD